MIVFGFGSGLTVSALVRKALYKQTCQYALQQSFDRKDGTDAYISSSADAIDGIRWYKVKT